MKDDMLTIGEVAKLFSTSVSTIRRAIDNGLLQGERVTPRSPRRVRRSEIERYAQEQGLRLNWDALKAP